MLALLEHFKDSAVQAVRLAPDKDVETRLKTARSLLKKLHKDEFFSSILFGGALRDSFCGVEPKDYDFCIWDARVPFLVQDASILVNGEFTNPGLEMQKKQAVIAALDETLKQAGIPTTRQNRQGLLEEWNIGVTGGKFLHSISEQLVRMGATMQPPERYLYKHISMVGFKGEMDSFPCDFVLAEAENKISAAEIAMYGDAPINCVAMDVSGEIWAHPKFLEDVKAQRYELRVLGQEAEDRATARVKSLHARYPALTFVR